eukprot:scaffold197550_cov31-Tisochrysis_lutea.AAC.3
MTITAHCFTYSSSCPRSSRSSTSSQMRISGRRSFSWRTIVCVWSWPVPHACETKAWNRQVDGRSRVGSRPEETSLMVGAEIAAATLLSIMSTERHTMATEITTTKIVV